MISEEDKIVFERLVNLITMNPADKHIMKNLCEKYKINGCNVCLSCNDAVRNLFKRVCQFYEKNKNN